MPDGEPDPELIKALRTREHELPTHTLSPETARAQRRGRHVPPEYLGCVPGSAIVRGPRRWNSIPVAVARRPRGPHPID